MGAEWAGHTKPVRAVPPIEGPDHDDFVAQEAKRADEIRNRDRRLFGEALVKFTQRVGALPELGGALATDQQFSELRVIEAMLTEVMTRGAVLRSRTRTHIGLYQATTGQPLPPYKAEPWPPAAAVDPSRCDNPWHRSAPNRANMTCPACPSRLAATPEDETCDNGEGGQ